MKVVPAEELTEKVEIVEEVDQEQAIEEEASIAACILFHYSQS